MERYVSISVYERDLMSLSTYQPDINKPYESPKIISILTVLFFRGSAASNIKFEPSLPEYGGKKCVSNAMVAFAAAAVHDVTIAMTH